MLALVGAEQLGIGAAGLLDLEGRKLPLQYIGAVDRRPVRLVTDAESPRVQGRGERRNKLDFGHVDLAPTDDAPGFAARDRARPDLNLRIPGQCSADEFNDRDAYPRAVDHDPRSGPQVRHQRDVGDGPGDQLIGRPEPEALQRPQPPVMQGVAPAGPGRQSVRLDGQVRASTATAVKSTCEPRSTPIQ